MEQISPVKLPQRYLQLLSQADGYEAAISVQPLWLVLYPASQVIDIAVSGTFEEFFPGFFVIGDNGGGEAIAFDLRSGREGIVVSLDMTNANLQESVWEVASNFDELLSKIEAA